MSGDDSSVGTESPIMLGIRRTRLVEHGMCNLARQPHVRFMARSVSAIEQRVELVGDLGAEKSFPMFKSSALLMAGDWVRKDGQGTPWDKHSTKRGDANVDAAMAFDVQPDSSYDARAPDSDMCPFELVPDWASAQPSLPGIWQSHAHGVC